jgi:hypothetical protein
MGYDNGVLGAECDVQRATDEQRSLDISAFVLRSVVRVYTCVYFLPACHSFASHRHVGGARSVGRVPFSRCDPTSPITTG